MLFIPKNSESGTPHQALFMKKCEIYLVFSANDANVITLVLTKMCIMGTINLRIDDELKNASFAELDKLGITPSDLLRQTLEYVVIHKKLPFKKTYLSDEDADLLEIVKERLANPQVVKVSLDDL